MEQFPAADLVIKYVDGGICSQMASVAYGMLLKEKYGDTVRVKYDLSWFKRFGCDNDGRLVRNWDFPKAFPGLQIDLATEDEVRLLSRGFEYRNLLSVDNLRTPAYLSGYPAEIKPNVCRWRAVLKEHFRPKLDGTDEEMAVRIDEKISCGVHFRRGDLANGNPGCGSATTVDYFLQAIEIVKGLSPGVVFYFFSDEIDWVQANVVPRLPKDILHVMVDGHGSDKGYIDLYLLSRCDYLISSIGSFGQYAALLSDKVRWLILSRRREEILDGFEHCIYINDDREFERQRHERDLEDRVVAENPPQPPRRFAYAVHALGYWLRHVVGSVSTDEYRWNVLRLKRRFSV